LHKRLRVLSVVATVVAISVGFIGAYAYVFGLGGSGTASAGTLPTFAPVSTSAATTPTTRPKPTTTTTIPVQPEPTTVKMPDPGHSLGIGARGPIVLAYEQRLASHQVFGLGQRAEDGLDQRRFAREFLADQGKAF